MRRKFPKIVYSLVCFLLILEQSGFAQVAGQLDISGYFTGLRNVLIQDKFRPLHLRYLSYDNTNNNLKLILDKGDLKPPQNQELENSTKELLNYFFVGISLPNDSFWVNLRPDSSGNIIDDYLVQTDVGKILLEADLQLKKDTAAFTSPQTIEGKKYWDSLYKKAGKLFGSENITIPTLTRPWIVPGEIIIRETQENAYVYKATLKVMLEQDYLKESATYNFSDERSKQLNEYASELIRETIIPKLTKDVNTAKRYAPLRQVYYSLILAQWFKQKFSGKSGLYSQLINKRNLNGLTSKEAWSKDTYFQAYQKSFKEGEYNIKEQVYTLQGQTIRNYMSGGIAIGGNVSEAINAGLRIPGNQKQAITLTSQIAGQLRPGIPQAPYSGELSIQSFTEKPIESASSPVEMEPGMVPKTIEIEGLKFYTNAALPAGAVGLNLSLEPVAGYPDLLIYGFPTPDGHIALNGGIINPANYALKEKNLLRPLLRKFFEFYPQADRTSESLMIPVMVKILIQDFGFQPKDGVRPNAWMGEPVNGKSDLYLTEEAWNLSFGKDGVKGLLPATSASMHIFNRVSDDFNGRDLNGKVLFPLYLGKGHALYRQPSGSASSPVDASSSDNKWYAQAWGRFGAFMQNQVAGLREFAADFIDSPLGLGVDLVIAVSAGYFGVGNITAGSMYGYTTTLALVTSATALGIAVQYAKSRIPAIGILHRIAIIGLLGLGISVRVGELRPYLYADKLFEYGEVKVLALRPGAVTVIDQRAAEIALHTTPRGDILSGTRIYLGATRERSAAGGWNASELNILNRVKGSPPAIYARTGRGVLTFFHEFGHDLPLKPRVGKTAQEQVEFLKNMKTLYEALGVKYAPILREGVSPEQYEARTGFWHEDAMEEVAERYALWHIDSWAMIHEAQTSRIVSAALGDEHNSDDEYLARFAEYAFVDKKDGRYFIRFYQLTDVSEVELKDYSGKLTFDELLKAYEQAFFSDPLANILSGPVRSFNAERIYEIHSRGEEVKALRGYLEDRGVIIGNTVNINPELDRSLGFLETVVPGYSQEIMPLIFDGLQFESEAAKKAREYPVLEQIFKRHGIGIQTGSLSSPGENYLSASSSPLDQGRQASSPIGTSGSTDSLQTMKTMLLHGEKDMTALLSAVPDYAPVLTPVGSEGISGGSVDGTGHRNYVDKVGVKWMFKEYPRQRLHRALVDDVVYKTALRLRLNDSMGVAVVRIGNVFGTLVQWFDNQGSLWSEIRQYGRNFTQHLSKETLRRIVREQVLDWLVSQHDSHGGSFLKVGSSVRAIDKSQAYKYIGYTDNRVERLALDYNPNAGINGAGNVSYIPIYNLVLEAIRKGTCALSLEEAWQEVSSVLAEAEKLSADEYVEMLRPYAVFRFDVMHSNEEKLKSSGEFLKLARARKEALSRDFIKFYRSLGFEIAENLNVISSSQSQTKISTTPDAVIEQRIKDHTIKAVILDLDGTLAPAGQPISGKMAELLYQLDRRGIRIIVISEETTTGVKKRIDLRMQQMGFVLSKPIIIRGYGGAHIIGAADRRWITEGSYDALGNKTEGVWDAGYQIRVKLKPGVDRKEAAGQLLFYFQAQGGKIPYVLFAESDPRVLKIFIDHKPEAASETLVEANVKAGETLIMVDSAGNRHVSDWALAKQFVQKGALVANVGPAEEGNLINDGHLIQLPDAHVAGGIRILEKVNAIKQSLDTHSSSPIEQSESFVSSPVDSVFTQDDRLNLSALQQILQAAIPEALRENVKPKIFGSAAYLADKGFIELAAIDDVDIGHELHGETKIRFSHKNYAENLRNIFSQAWGEKRVTGIESFALPHDFEGMETFSHYYFYITSAQGYRLKITVPPSTSTDMAGFVAQDVATIVKTPEYRLDKPIKRNLLLVAYLGGYLKETPTIDTLRAEYIGIIHLPEGSGRNNALKQFELKLSAIAARLKERYRNEIVGREAELSGLKNFIRRKLDAAIIISPLGRSESASSSPITIEQIRSKVAKDSEEILIDVLTTPNAKGGRQPRTVWFDYDKRLLITVFDVENEQFRRQLQQSVLNKSISGSEGLRNIINGIMGQPESAFIALNRYIIEVNNLDRLRGESGIVTRRQTRIRILEDLKNSLIPLAMVSIINGRLSRSKANTRGQVEIQFNPKDLPYVKQALELLPGLDAGILESASILVIQVEPMAGASSPIKTKQDGSRVKEDRDSSLMVETKDVKGGIDFRTMPASIQRVSNLPLGNVPVAMPLASINLDESLGQIQNMLKAGIIPSSERIREYLQSCCRKKDMGQDIDKILACIADILRLQEDRATSTDLSLKEMLALLESNKSASEMQLVLAKITVAEKESLEIVR